QAAGIAGDAQVRADEDARGRYVGDEDMLATDADVHRYATAAEGSQTAMNMQRPFLAGTDPAGQIQVPVRRGVNVQVTVAQAQPDGRNLGSEAGKGDASLRARQVQGAMEVDAAVDAASGIDDFRRQQCHQRKVREVDVDMALQGLVASTVTSRGGLQAQGSGRTVLQRGIEVARVAGEGHAAFQACPGHKFAIRALGRFLPDKGDVAGRTFQTELAFQAFRVVEAQASTATQF